jgi:hypothetical protein
MNVEQVIAHARNWVDSRSAEIPGFRGAHLKGSILGMPEEATFPAYRDVDINLVISGRPRGVQIEEISYQGLIFDCASYSADFYASPEAILANGSLAPNMTGGGLLVDPEGLLVKLQATVAREYDRRPWVEARCMERKTRISESLARLTATAAPEERARHLWFLVVDLAGIVALASLKPPTHRRGLVRMRKLMFRHGRRDLHEAILDLLGLAHLERAEAETALAECASLFDRAIEVQRDEPCLKPHTRPNVIDASKEMIEAGDYREAMHWISAQMIRAITVIQAWGSAEDRKWSWDFAARLLTRMRVTGPGAAEEVHRRAEPIAGDVIRFADEIVASSPAVRD